MAHLFKKALPSIGIGPINVNLPKEAISGKVPALLVWTAGVAIAGTSLYLWHQKNERDREAKKEIARLNAQNRKSHYNNCQKQTDDISAEESETQESNDENPEWVNAATIEDKKTDSALLGQSGALVLVKGREGSGKSTLTNQLLIEGCEGKSSNLFPNMVANGPQWTAFLYASEASPKFHSNFGEKLKELDGRFKALVNNFKFKNVETALDHMRKSVMNVSGNCAVAIDNITDMFPNLTSAQIKLFIGGLKAIRSDMNAQGREITFIVVTHANRVTEEASGSALWQNLFEEVLSIKDDKQATDSNCKILNIEKSRLGATSSVPIHRLMTPFMHFEVRSKEEVETDAVDDKSASEDSISMLPVTEDVEDFFASIYIPNQYGYGQIFNEYKNKYDLRSKDTVRYAIARSQKRKKAA